MAEKSVEEVIEEFRRDLNEGHSKYLQIPRENIEAIVSYFDDIDEFKTRL
jgi:hypothetical protein